MLWCGDLLRNPNSILQFWEAPEGYIHDTIARDKIYLLFFHQQALSLLNIIELLLQVWKNGGMLHMVGFASKYISIYDYRSGYGKTFSGKLQIQKGKTGGYYTLLLIPFFVIAGLQFLH